MASNKSDRRTRQISKRVRDNSAYAIVYYNYITQETKHLAIGSNLAISNNTINASGSVTSEPADGDKGDITVSDSGFTWTVDDGVITYAKIQDVGAYKLLGNPTISSAPPSEISVSPYVVSILNSVNSSEFRANTESIIGTDVQEYDSFLASIADLGTAPDKIIYTTGVDTAAETAITAFARALLDDANASTMRSTLGLGTLATQNGTFSGTHSGTSSGTNTGDQDLSGYFLTANFASSFTTELNSKTTDDLTEGSTNKYYTDEKVDDRVAALCVPGSNMTITYDDGTNTLTFESTGGGSLADGDYGDVTVSGSGATITIDNNVVTYAKMQDVSTTSRFLGRKTAGAGDVEELSNTDAKTILAIANTDVSGLGSLAVLNDLSTFDTDDLAEGTTNKYFDSTSSSKLAGIESGADVTDATNVAAAGAVMEADTSTAAMSFVIDEDNMASNSATKVPTQQSVKAYVDANAGGGGLTIGKAYAISIGGFSN